MAQESFINEQGDMKWLNDVHFGGRLSKRFKSAVIFGNKDWPSKIHLYRKKDPLYTDKPVVVKPS